MDDALIHQIGTPGETRVFTLHEAQALFPVVQAITESAWHELEPVRNELAALSPANPRFHEIEAHYEAVVRRWVSKMQRLGLVTKGLWLVDFDTGDGYLCWRYPELHLGHYHGYSQGYAERRPLREIVEERDPDWAV